MIFRSIICVIVLSVSFCTLKAQNFIPNASLIVKNDRVATIRSVGVDRNKKAAIEMAVKSALYTYYFYGIEGLNDNKPLLGSSPSQQAKEHAMGVLNNGRYTVFRSNVILNEDDSKSVKGGYEAVVSVDIYVNSLYQDLVNNGVLSKRLADMTLGDTQEKIALPTVMIVPYCTNGETFLQAIKRNSDIRIAMAKISEAFIKQGVETTSIESELESAGEYEARRGDISMEDLFIRNSKSDVVVAVDVTKDITFEGTRISLILTATETANRKIVAQKSEVSGRRKTSPDMICGSLANLMAKDFINQVAMAMARKIDGGNALSIDFIVSSDGVMNMDTRVGADNMPLSLEISQWLRKIAKNGKYHQKGRSSTLLSFDEIKVENKSADGHDMGVADFEREIYLFMDKLNVGITTNVVGNKVEVIIN